MTISAARFRRAVGLGTLAALLLLPARVRAQETTPPAHPPKQTATPAPPQATKTGSFSQLQAAIERIQKRVNDQVGATSVPQTAVTAAVKPPKPADATKAPAKPADAKPAPTDAKAAASAKPAAPAAKPGESAMTPAPAAAKPLRRIQLNWRSTLVWPKEIAPPAPTPSSGRIGLIWR
jgi:hypothetical protein